MNFVAALLAALPLAVLAEEAPAPPPAAARAASADAAPSRSAWYLQLGLGTGNAVVRSDGADRTLRDLLGGDPARLALQLGVGATLSPRLLLGLELTTFRAGAADRDPVLGSLRNAVQITSASLVATFFPVERGFFFRGGAGPSSIRFEKGSSNRSYGGVSLVGGVGNAWWIGERFNLSLALDASRQWYSGKSAPSRSSSWLLYLGFGWY